VLPRPELFLTLKAVAYLKQNWNKTVFDVSETAKTLCGCFIFFVLVFYFNGWNKALFYFSFVSVLFQLFFHLDAKQRRTCLSHISVMPTADNMSADTSATDCSSPSELPLTLNATETQVNTGIDYRVSGFNDTTEWFWLSTIVRLLSLSPSSAELGPSNFCTFNNNNNKNNKTQPIICNTLPPVVCLWLLVTRWF